METEHINIHQELIERCREGCREAQFQLYRLYYKAMFNVSLRIVNDHFEAEDAMQEAFLSAFEKLDTYKGEVTFGAWLKKIVINRSLDYLKKRKVNFEEINDRMLNVPEPENKEPRVSIEAIKEAIHCLPDGYRTVLSLYLLEGYDHEEIGQILGISNPASRTQYSRAKKRLQEILKEKEILSFN